MTRTAVDMLMVPIRVGSRDRAGAVYLIFPSALAGEVAELVGGLGPGPGRAGSEAAATAIPAPGDPVVGHAVRLLTADPARRWTVAELAHRTAVSRASLARRFTALVGEPPMTYLTRWRIALAAELLRETTDTVDAIARKVGYANAFALSVAFKRLRGLSPTAHRRGDAVIADPAQPRTQQTTQPTTAIA